MKLSVKQGLKKMPRNIVQINNRFIQDENQRRRYLDEERRKRNRFMGWVLILVILLFILPTYNLYQSYQTKAHLPITQTNYFLYKKYINRHPANILFSR